MSVAVSRSDGVTVLTLTSDPSSNCPPFCQLLGALCYTPNLCSASRRLPVQRGRPQAALGALWIISGILYIGLGLILITTRGVAMYMLRDTYCPVWMGALAMFFGVCCILTEKCPKPAFVLLTGLLNLTGVALSITAIVWNATDIDSPGFWSFCERERYDYDYSWNRHAPTTTATPQQRALLERCEEARELLRALASSLCAMLLILSALHLCLGISSATLSFKSLKQGATKSGNKALLTGTEATTLEDE